MTGAGEKPTSLASGPRPSRLSNKLSRLGFLGALLITGTLGLTASSGPAYLVKDINARFGFLAASLAGWVEGPAVFFIVE